MTNEEIRARMWEAYKAGIKMFLGGDTDTTSDEDFERGFREEFHEWLTSPEHFPELLEDENKVFTGFDTSDIQDDITPNALMLCIKSHETTYDGYTHYHYHDTMQRSEIGVFISDNWSKVTASTVIIPNIGDQTIIDFRWGVEANTMVVLDQVIAFLETDKASFELTAESIGRLQPIIEDDANVKVGDIVGYIVQ